MNKFISTFADPKTWIIVLLVVAMIMVAASIYWQLKFTSAEKQSKIDSGIISRNIERSATLLYMSELSADLRIAEQSIRRKGLRKEIAILKSVIDRLKGEKRNLVVDFENKETEYKERIQHLTETVEKRKHQLTKTEVNSELWESLTIMYGQFPINELFGTGKEKVFDYNLLRLVGLDGISYLVDKSHFKPV